MTTFTGQLSMPACICKVSLDKRVTRDERDQVNTHHFDHLLLLIARTTVGPGLPHWAHAWEVHGGEVEQNRGRYGLGRTGSWRQSLWTFSRYGCRLPPMVHL